jgi:3-oxoacyl-[acyl-carrier protein] reductase
MLAEDGVDVSVTHLGHRDEALAVCKQIEAMGRKAIPIHLDHTDPASCAVESVALAVSKAGLIHLTRCLAVALAPSITVNCIAPGLMEGTRMSARVPPARVAASKAQAALKRTTRLEDVARQVVLFCRSDSVTGQTQVIDAGTVFH